MPKYFRGGVRLLGALALVALLTPFSGAIWGATAGRDYSRCIQGCNDARRACNARCSDDCKAMFPNDTAAITACISACKNDTCVVESGDCKLQCEQIKNPYTEEP